MNKAWIIATNSVAAPDLNASVVRSIPRFGRMDLTSQLSLLAVEPFAPHFESMARNRIAILLGTRAGSLSTDVSYWAGRDQPGGLSPTLFTYTLPSAAIGEIAIRHRLTGPNLCLVGTGLPVLSEAAALLNTGEADACVVVDTQVVSTALTRMIQMPEIARADAVLLARTGPGLLAWGENQSDMESLCATLRAQNLTK